jgi:hypothetical protein
MHSHTRTRTHARTFSACWFWVVNSQRLFRSAFSAAAVPDSKICLHFCHFLSSLHFGEHSLPFSQNRPSPPTHTLTALRFYSHIIGFFLDKNGNYISSKYVPRVWKHARSSLFRCMEWEASSFRGGTLVSFLYHNICVILAVSILPQRSLIKRRVQVDQFNWYK